MYKKKGVGKTPLQRVKRERDQLRERNSRLIEALRNAIVCAENYQYILEKFDFFKGFANEDDITNAKIKDLERQLDESRAKIKDLERQVSENLAELAQMKEKRKQ